MKDTIPMYEMDRTERRRSRTDSVDKIFPWIIKIIALLGMFALALIYDGVWIYVFFGVSSVLLGVELKNRWMKS